VTSVAALPHIGQGTRGVGLEPCPHILCPKCFIACQFWNVVDNHIYHAWDTDQIVWVQSTRRIRRESGARPVISLSNTAPQYRREGKGVAIPTSVSLYVYALLAFALQPLVDSDSGHLVVRKWEDSPRTLEYSVWEVGVFQREWPGTNCLNRTSRRSKGHRRLGSAAAVHAVV
jgi:hypothetical protein